MSVIGSAGLSALVGVKHVDPDSLAADTVNDLPQRFRGTPITADDSSEILWVHPHFQPAASPIVD
jgi:hypothetical protein